MGEQADAEIEDRYPENAGPEPKPSSAPRPPKLTGWKG